MSKPQLSVMELKHGRIAMLAHEELKSALPFLKDDMHKKISRRIAGRIKKFAETPTAK